MEELVQQVRVEHDVLAVRAFQHLPLALEFDENGLKISLEDGVVQCGGLVLEPPVLRDRAIGDVVQKCLARFDAIKVEVAHPEALRDERANPGIGTKLLHGPPGNAGEPVGILILLEPSEDSLAGGVLISGVEGLVHGASLGDLAASGILRISGTVDVDNLCSIDPFPDRLGSGLFLSPAEDLLQFFEIGCAAKIGDIPETEKTIIGLGGGVEILLHGH